MNNHETYGVAWLLVATVTTTSGLHALGRVPGFAVDWQRPLVWMSTSAPTDLIGAAFRYTGLAVGYWVLVTTALYYVFALAQADHRRGWVALFTLPAIRRLVDRTVAASLALSVLATPVASLGAETTTPMPPPVVFATAPDGIPVPHVSPPATGQPEAAAEDPEPATPSVNNDPAVDPVQRGVDIHPWGDAAAPTRSETETTHEVEPGDNLWTIATSHLRTVLGDNPTGNQIGEYWRKVIAANRDTLRSGDPNLIYPGELILLPVTSVQP
jgi:hypothetical protein